MKPRQTACERPDMDRAANRPQSKLIGRGLAFRLIAVLLGLGLVLLIEGVLRLTGVGRSQDTTDPLVGFSQVVPLFVLNEAGDQYVIPRSRQVFFQPDSFAAEKGDTEFRIFCLGGSTVQGRPYSIETSFTTWLELNLQAADPTRKWQVVNCGGVSYASYRLLPIMQELLAHQPDLFIVYTGHNEFLEERSYGDIKRQAPWLRRLHERLGPWRIYGVARMLLKPTPAKTKVTNMAAEVDALLDYQGGLAKYHRDDAWRDGVVYHFEQNLREMASLARTVGVPLLLANPVSNLRDTPPFKAEVDSQLSDADRNRFDRLWEQAKQASWEDLTAKTKLLREVLALDPRHPEAHFLLAKVLEARGEMAATKSEYLRAKDEDICPLRMLESMHAIVHQVAEETDTPLIDIRRLFERQAKDGIPGNAELIDHVHPHIEGHQQIANEYFRYLADQKIVTPVDGWASRQQELYQANFASLPANYFPEGRARLEGLQKWAEGRVTRLRPREDDHK